MADHRLVPQPGEPLAAPATQRTLAELLAEVIAHGRSVETRRAYRSDLQDFLDWRVGLEQSAELPHEVEAYLESGARDRINQMLRTVCATTELDIRRYLAHLQPSRGEALSDATISRRLTPLRLLFQRLLRHHLIASDPTEFVKGPKLSTTSETIYLTSEQARFLEDSCIGPTLMDKRDRALLALMLSTGLRSSEVIGLQLSDMRRVNKHSVAYITGKGGQRERVKIPPTAYQHIQAYLHEAGITAGPVFQRLRLIGPRQPPEGAVRTYKPSGALTYRGLYDILKRRFLAAVPAEPTRDETEAAREFRTIAAQLRPHSTRHTFVTLALKGGASLAQSQAAARHKDPRTTTRYAHDLDDLDDNAVDYVQY